MNAKNTSEALLAITAAACGIGRNTAAAEQADARGNYEVECLGADGRLKWVDSFDNLVTTIGKNDALDKYLTGSSYTAAWYVGLMSSNSYTTGPAVSDTASVHGGWAEDQNYTQAARPTAAWSAASGGSKALSSAAVFSINATTTIKGCFLITLGTKGAATGLLYSAGLFSGGDKVVANGDTLNVSYTASL